MANDGIQTSVLPVDARNIGRLTANFEPSDYLDSLHIELSNTQDARNLRHAADQLQTTAIPVAFPTETVYGLAADATRSDATLGIFAAKGRPADNPLIVHFASLHQLRALLRSGQTPSSQPNPSDDPIPAIYKPLITRFWPGPLTLILPLPTPSPLAPECTATLPTFGARIPRHPLALALIQLANAPLAAPSANASTKPSPTAAEHVAHDLHGRITTILDGGPCDVGVESTVVDGLSVPPVVLRPGGVSIEQIRACPGWEDVRVGYQNAAEGGAAAPRAPGMKYRHYSPKATVILHENGSRILPALEEMEERIDKEGGRVGVITTKSWVVDTESTMAHEGPPYEVVRPRRASSTAMSTANGVASGNQTLGFAGMLETLKTTPTASNAVKMHNLYRDDEFHLQIHEVALGGNTADVARGIFAALRELDRRNVKVIFVEGIDESEGDTAAAVMNRLRKAAEVKVA